MLEKINNKVGAYLKPSDKGVRTRDLVREFMHQGGFKPGVDEVKKAIPRDMARFGISALEAPKAIMKKEASGKFYNTPVGRINSFQSEAQNRVNRGDPLWKAMGNPMLDTVLAGSDVGVLASGAAKMMRPGIAAMRGVNLQGGMDLEKFKRAKLEKLIPMVEQRRPFYLSSRGNQQQQSALRDADYEPAAGYGSEGSRWNHNPPASMSKPPRGLGFDMEGDGGFGTADRLPRDVTDEVTRFSALLKDIRQGAKRIILPDIDPVRPRPYNPSIGDTEETLIRAGYRSERSKGSRLAGIWKLKYKGDLKEFMKNPHPKLRQADGAEEISGHSRERIDDEDAYLQQSWVDDFYGGDYARRNGVMRPTGDFVDQFKGLTPESYGQDLADDFSRTFHPNQKSFRRAPGKELFKRNNRTNKQK